MMLIRLCLYAILLSLGISCKTSKIIVVGRAENDKDAAIITTDKDLFYILDGLDEWDDMYYGKKVKVSGKLKIEIHERKSTDSVLVQERVGTWWIIKKPIWSLADTVSKE